MLKFSRYIIALLTVMTTLSAAALSSERRHELRDSLRQLYPTLTDTRSRVSALYNIYDLSTSRPDRVAALKDLYEVARAHDIPNVQLDVLTHLANILRDNMDALTAIASELGTFVKTDREKEVELFVSMLISDIHTRQENDEGFSEFISGVFRRENEQPILDGYERALMLYNLCNHLAKTTSGELLEQYTLHLEGVIDSLPLPAGSVRNLIYTRAAPVFTNNQNYKKAVEIDKKMINIIDSLTDSYHRKGRPYRDLNTSRFTCYRRLLGNYKGLLPVEIDALYDKIHMMARNDERIARDENNLQRTEIFYNLAKERYAEAIGIIKKQIDKPGNERYRLYYLTALVEAAEKIGDRATQLNAAVELNKLLRNEIKRRTSERYRELEILYEVNALRDARAAAVSAHESSRIKAGRIFVAILTIVIIALIVLILLLMKKNRKIKRMSAKKSAISQRLLAERNELQRTQQELIAARNQAKDADKLKTDFINNMGHEIKTPLNVIAEYSKLIVDCVPDNKNNYLHRFANVIEKNTALINTLFSDVLDVASLEHDTMSLNTRPTGIYDMCEFALDNLFEEAGVTSKGVEVIFNKANKPDGIVVTDPQRVGQVLMNMLNNADKFTEKGTIDLEFDLDKTAGTLTFTVSDTGIGIPASQADTIFERFRKLDNSAPGCGLGLYISRLIAKLLKGSIRLDTSHHGGARFIFTIPTK